MKRPRVNADYAAVADGRHLYLVGFVDGIPSNDGWTIAVVLRHRGRHSGEMTYPVSTQRSDGSRLHFSATVPLEGDGNVVEGRREVLVELTPSVGPAQKLPVRSAFDLREDDGPTSSNPPSRQTGRLHRLKAARGKPLRVDTSSTPDAVMVTAVNSTITRLEVEFELVGTDVAAPDPARDHAELSRRDNESVIVTMPLVPLADGRWRIEVPIAEVVERSDSKTLWDFWLIRRKAGLRIGLELSDLRNPRPSFVYPFVPIAAAGHSWRVIPYYTLSKTLALSARWVDVEVGAE